MEHYVAHLESLYLGDFYYFLEQISDPIEEKNSTVMGSRNIMIMPLLSAEPD